MRHTSFALLGALVWVAATSCNKKVEPVTQVTPKVKGLAAIVDELGGRLSPDKETPGYYFVNLGGCKISSENLKALAQFQDIAIVNLSDTNVSDVALDQMIGLKELRVLYLSGTSITSVGVAKLSGLTKLRELFLDRTQMRGKDFACLKDLASLETLWVDSDQTTFDVLPILDSHPTLQDVYIMSEAGFDIVWGRGTGANGPKGRHWKKGP